MKKIGVYEAKTTLPQLLREVAAGEYVAITKHGVTIAKLVAATDSVLQVSPKAAVTGLRAFQKQRLAKGETIREFIEEGRNL